MIKKKEREWLDALAAEGFEIVSQAVGKHFKVRASIKGVTRLFVFPLTPNGGRRVEQNARAHIKRTKKEILSGSIRASKQ